MLYLSICRLINIDISQLFIGSSVYDRFKQYLKDAGLDDGETPHSLRAGCSITLELLGVSKSAIA